MGGLERSADTVDLDQIAGREPLQTAPRRAEGVRLVPLAVDRQHDVQRAAGDAGVLGEDRPSVDRPQPIRVRRRPRPRTQRGATRSSSSKARRTQSRATCDVTRRWRSRSNGNRNSYASLPFPSAKPT